MASFANIPCVEEYLAVIPVESHNYLFHIMKRDNRKPIKTWSPLKLHRGQAPLSYAEAEAMLIQQDIDDTPELILTDIPEDVLSQAIIATIREPFDTEYLEWKTSEEQYLQSINLDNVD